MPPVLRKRARRTLRMKAARPSLLKPSRLISAVALDEAEHARLRIARLGQRRDRADLDAAEAERAEGIDAAAVLVEPRGQADAVGKAQAGQRHGILDPALGDRVDQRRVLDRRHRAESEIVRVLGVEPEQERSGEGIGQERHRRGDSGIARCILDAEPSIGCFRRSAERRART